MPGLDDALALAPLEPPGQLGVGDDVPAAGQRLVPGGGAVLDGGGTGRDTGLLVAHHPQVFQLGAAPDHFLVDGARRVGVLPAVEAAVQHRVAQRCGAPGPVALAQQPLAARAAFRRREHRRAVDQQLVVAAPLDGVRPAAEGAGGGQGAVGGGRDAQRGVVRLVQGAPLAEEEVPVPLAQRQFPAGALDGVRPQHGPEPAAPAAPERVRANRASSPWPLCLATRSTGRSGRSGKVPSRRSCPSCVQVARSTAGCTGRSLISRSPRGPAVRPSSRRSSPVPASG